MRMQKHSAWSWSHMLRHMSDTAFHFLLLLYNKVYEGVFPDAWGKALVLSSLKKPSHRLILEATGPSP